MYFRFVQSRKHLRISLTIYGSGSRVLEFLIQDPDMYPDPVETILNPKTLDLLRFLVTLTVLEVRLTLLT